MAKYVDQIRHCDVIAFPGININWLANKIQHNNIILDKQFTIVHVGTNDIHSLKAEEIISCFRNLISVIRQKSHTEIVMSAIIPRPVDYISTGDKVIKVNSDLKRVCQKKEGWISTHIQAISYKLPVFKGVICCEWSRSAFEYGGN